MRAADGGQCVAESVGYEGLHHANTVTESHVGGIDHATAHHAAADYPAADYPAADYPAAHHRTADYPAAHHRTADYPAADDGAAHRHADHGYAV